MMLWLFVAAGGAAGAVARYAVYQLLQRLEQHAALATLGVNALGAFLMGVLYVLFTHKTGLGLQWQNLLGVGFLGAFTTYSTYSLDALKLLQQGQHLASLLYLLGTMLLCLLAVWLGAILARMF